MANKILNRGLILIWLAISVPALVVLPTSAHAQSAAAPPPGALIRMDMNSVVGVLLDDIPTGAQREAAADWALSQADDFWEKRASTQVNLTYYRLVYRTFFYTAPITALPLPPHSDWRIDLVGNPQRMQIGTHDYVAVKYHFWTYIVTDAASADASQPQSCQHWGHVGRAI